MKRLILIILILFVLIGLYYGTMRTEKFFNGSGKALFNEPLIKTVTSFLTTKTLFLNFPTGEHDVTIDRFLKPYQGIKKVDNSPYNKFRPGDNLYYTDVYTYLDKGWDKDNHVLAPLYFGKICMFITTDEITSRVTSLDEFSTLGTKLYYINEEDLHLMDIIMKANGVYEYETEQLNVNKLDEFFDKQNPDKRGFFLFSTMNNDFTYKVQQYDYNVVLYEGIDMEKVKATIPFARRELVTLERTQVSEEDEENVFTFFGVMIDTILFGKKDQHNKYFGDIIKYQNVPKQISYFTQYFSFYPISMEIMKANNERIETRGTRNILEQFEEEGGANDKINFIINYDIPGTRDYKISDYYTEFNYRGTVLDNANLKVGDRVLLQGQDFKRENGLYYVKKVEDKKTVMSSSIYTKIDKNTMEVEKNAYKNEIKVIPKERTKELIIGNIKLIPKDKIYFSDIKKYCRFTINDEERRWECKVLNLPEISEEYNPEYKCFNDPEILTKGMCESPVDNYGLEDKPKEPGVWDRRCKKDTDCPFFQANKNRDQSLYRGGCNNGFCELPVGVKRNSFRKYSTEGNNKPKCRNCKEGRFYSDCCEDQKDRSKYPELNSPDYIFPHEETQQMYMRN